jgi:hypothetical protein
MAGIGKAEAAATPTLARATNWRRSMVFLPYYRQPYFHLLSVVGDPKEKRSAHWSARKIARTYGTGWFSACGHEPSYQSADNGIKSFMLASSIRNFEWSD